MNKEVRFRHIYIQNPYYPKWLQDWPKMPVATLAREDLGVSDLGGQCDKEMIVKLALARTNLTCDQFSRAEGRQRATDRLKATPASFYDADLALLARKLMDGELVAVPYSQYTALVELVTEQVEKRARQSVKPRNPPFTLRLVRGQGPNPALRFLHRLLLDY